MKTAVLLPTYNEEENIEGTIKSIRKADKKYEIFVVDSGSKDRTVKIAKKLGAKVISVEGRGKGKAVRVAFSEINADFLVMMDADGTYPAEKIPEFLEKLRECDVVIGSRFAGRIEEGAMKQVNRIGNRMLTFFARLLYKRKITDVCSGMWGFRREAYKRMEITAPHFELEADLFSEAVKKNMKICEVPIVYRKRGGVAKLRVSDGVKIAWWLAKKRFSGKEMFFMVMAAITALQFLPIIAGLYEYGGLGTDVFRVVFALTAFCFGWWMRKNRFDWKEILGNGAIAGAIAVAVFYVFLFAGAAIGRPVLGVAVPEDMWAVLLVVLAVFNIVLTALIVGVGALAAKIVKRC